MYSTQQPIIPINTPSYGATSTIANNQNFPGFAATTQSSQLVYPPPQVLANCALPTPAYSPPAMQTPSIPFGSQAFLEDFQIKYEINVKHMPFLQKLSQFQFIFILDDSGSMSYPADSDLGGSSMTRWEELKQFMKIVLEAHQILGNLSCDCYFINRGMVKNVKSYAQLKPFLAEPPKGYTNTLNILHLIRKHYHLDHNGQQDNKLLMLHILTDGHATTEQGVEDMRNFNHWITHRPNRDRFFVSITLCTDDESIDRAYRPCENAENVDVSLDYRGECQEIYCKRGRKYRFSYGDYVVKILVGSIDREIHNVDLLPPVQCCCIA